MLLICMNMNAPNLLSKLSINTAVRSHNFLLLVRHRMKYGLLKPVINMLRIFNKFAHLFVKLSHVITFDMRFLQSDNEMN